MTDRPLFGFGGPKPGFAPFPWGAELLGRKGDGEAARGGEDDATRARLAVARFCIGKLGLGEMQADLTAFGGEGQRARGVGG